MGITSCTYRLPYFRFIAATASAWSTIFSLVLGVFARSVTAAVTDLAATPGVKIKMVDHGDLAEKMNAKYGKLYSAGTLKAGSYPNQDKDNQLVDVWNILVTGDRMTDDDAYKIVRTLVEKKADLVAVHKEAASFSLENQVQERSPIPFHPGAMRFFKEQGVKG